MHYVMCGEWTVWSHVLKDKKLTLESLNVRRTVNRLIVLIRTPMALDYTISRFYL